MVPPEMSVCGEHTKENGEGRFGQEEQRGRRPRGENVLVASGQQAWQGGVHWRRLEGQGLGLSHFQLPSQAAPTLLPALLRARLAVGRADSCLSAQVRAPVGFIHLHLGASAAPDLGPSEPPSLCL